MPLLQGTNLLSGVEADAGVMAILTDENGYMILGRKTTTGNPSTTANIYQPSCMIFNTADAVININVGSLATPSWETMDSS